jgi:hypothetical protein
VLILRSTVSYSMVIIIYDVEIIQCHATAYVVRHWLLTAEPWGSIPGDLCEIALDQVLSEFLRVLPADKHSTVALHPSTTTL